MVRDERWGMVRVAQGESKTTDAGFTEPRVLITLPRSIFALFPSSSPAARSRAMSSLKRTRSVAEGIVRATSSMQGGRRCAIVAIDIGTNES